MPIPIVAGAVAGGLLGAAGDIFNGMSQKQANEDNLQWSKDQFLHQILLSQIGRGAAYEWPAGYIPGATSFKTGTPIKMPYYGVTGGDSDEVLAYRRANDIFNSINTQWGSPQQQLQSYTNIANQSKPAIADATKSINDLFSGQRTQQRLAEQAPVNQARINTAQGQRSAVYQNLQSRLNELKAKQANQGFVGSSTFDRSAQFREAMPYLQEASNVMSAARLQNALDEQSIRNQDWQTAFANVNVPYDIAAKNIAFEQMPALSATNAFNQAFSVYSPFLMGQYSAPGPQQLPTIQPVTGWGEALSNAGADFLQSYLKDQAAREAADQYRADQKEWLNTIISANKPSTYNPAAYSYGGIDPYGN